MAPRDSLLEKIRGEEYDSGVACCFRDDLGNPKAGG
jgi:hypothetical protein